MPGIAGTVARLVAAGQPTAFNILAIRNSVVALNGPNVFDLQALFNFANAYQPFTPPGDGDGGPDGGFDPGGGPSPDPGPGDPGGGPDPGDPGGAGPGGIGGGL